MLHCIEVEEIQDELDKDAPETNAEHLLDDVADAVWRPRQHRGIYLYVENQSSSICVDCV